MLFSSTIFLFGFLPLVLFGYFLILRKNKSRNYFLLLVSLLFYAWGEPVFVLLMILSIVSNYLFGIGLDKASTQNKRRIWLVLSVIFNLSILFFFKYLNFAADNLGLLFNTTISIPIIELPIGISFFTFQSMSYVIDVYRKTVNPQRDPLALGLYISFFPQLIAGPIVRYSTIEEQINHRTISIDKFQDGICRFIQGFSKKIILSNTMSLIAEHGFALAQKNDLSVAMAWLGALAYTFQIYFDFSGYSDMAVGLGKMFGFEFDENFRYPYLSRSVSEFWNRWHISLGQWFRDYVYFPLGGSRVGKCKLIRNLFVVWLLTGIWHGAAWQFILWGIGYGIIISIEKLTGFPKRLKRRFGIILYGIFTFLIVNAGWVIFGAPDLQAGLTQLGSMIGIGTVKFLDGSAIFHFCEYLPFYMMAILFSTPLPHKFLTVLSKKPFCSLFITLIHIALLLISVSYLAIGSHNPFIYFNF